MPQRKNKPMERVDPSPASNPYAAPTVSTHADEPDDPGPAGPVDLDQQLARTQLTFLVRAGAVALAMGGGLLFFAGLQLWGAVTLLGPIRFVPWAMLGLGALQIVLGVKVYRQRVWAAWSGAIIAGIVGLATMYWFLLSTVSGFISLLALMTPFFELGAAVMAFLALPSCRRAAAARRRLAADGLDVDF